MALDTFPELGRAPPVVDPAVRFPPQLADFGELDEREVEGLRQPHTDPPSLWPNLIEGVTPVTPIYANQVVPAPPLVDPIDRPSRVFEQTSGFVALEERQSFFEQLEVPGFLEVTGERQHQPKGTVIVDAEVVRAPVVAELTGCMTIRILVARGSQDDLSRPPRIERDHTHGVLECVPVAAQTLPDDPG